MNKPGRPKLSESDKAHKQFLKEEKKKDKLTKKGKPQKQGVIN